MSHLPEGDNIEAIAPAPSADSPGELSVHVHAVQQGLHQQRASEGPQGETTWAHCGTRHIGLLVNS